MKLFSIIAFTLSGIAMITFLFATLATEQTIYFIALLTSIFLFFCVFTPLCLYIEESESSENKK